MIVIVPILIRIIVSDGVFSLITTLFSSGTTLLIPYNGSDDYDGLLIALNIKPGVYNLGNYNFNIYSFSA